MSQNPAPLLAAQTPLPVHAATPLPVTLAMAPGTSTSEFRFSAGVGGLITLVYLVFMVLVNTGAVHVAAEWVASASGIVPIVLAYLANGYAQSRATVKAGATVIPVL